VNTWLAVAYDLKVFFEVISKDPAEVTAADVFAFLAAQRAPRRGDRVVRIEDGEPGLAARTIARRLSRVAGDRRRPQASSWTVDGMRPPWDDG
jgi:hypothetical protein